MKRRAAKPTTRPAGKPDPIVKRRAGSAEKILNSLPEEVVVGVAEDLLELVERREARGRSEPAKRGPGGDLSAPIGKRDRSGMG